MTPETEAIARIARDRNRAQDAARHATEALAHLDMAAEALGGAGSEDIRARAAAASGPLRDLVLLAVGREKAAQARFSAAWEEFRQSGTAEGQVPA